LCQRLVADTLQDLKYFTTRFALILINRHTISSL
jgi:hypothetical protein